MIQSVVFYKTEMTMKEALAFLRRHGYRTDKLDITPNTYRFRQADPDVLERRHYRFRTRGFPGGFFVLAYEGDVRA